MDYLPDKFGDFSFILLSADFVKLVLSCGHTDRITEADERYTHATTVHRKHTMFLYAYIFVPVYFFCYNSLHTYNLATNVGRHLCSCIINHSVFQE